MAIRIKRSSGNTAPALLESGQLAYVEGATNGGTLYYGEIGGTVRAIAGKQYVDKVNGIEAGAQVNTVTSVAGRTGAITLAVGDVSNAESTANKGAANGYASLDSGGKVPSTQLPSYVDDVLEYNNLAGFPATGTAGIIYVAQDTNKTYRWSGSAYVEISPSPGSTDAVTEGSTNLYFTQARARQSISVTDSGGDGALSYDNSTGVITYTGPSATDVRAHFSAGTGITITNGQVATTITQYTNTDARGAVSATDAGGDGSFSYDSGTGVFTYTGPGTTDYRAAFSAGTGITITSGVIASTVTDTNTTYAISAETATGGVNLRLTGSDSSTDNVKLAEGSNITITRTDADTITIASTGSGGMQDLIDDTTPQLGGDLDVNGKKIVSVSNGNIVIAPNGSGSIVLNEAGTAATLARRTASTGTISNAIIAQRNFTADTLSNMDGHAATIAFGLRDSALATSTFTRLGGEYSTTGDHAFFFETSTNNFTAATRIGMWAANNLVLGTPSTSTTQNLTTIDTQDLVLSTNFGTNSGTITIQDGADGDITVVPNGIGKVHFETSETRVGKNNTNAKITTKGTGDLTLDTNSGTNSGSIVIYDGANGNISITPNGTGSIVLDGLNWPQADGTANYVLKTNGSGQLSWVAQPTVITAFTGLTDVPATYSGSGGYYVKVNSGATALEFSQHVDDGTF